MGWGAGHWRGGTITGSGGDMREGQGWAGRGQGGIIPLTIPGLLPVRGGCEGDVEGGGPDPLLAWVGQGGGSSCAPCTSRSNMTAAGAMTPCAGPESRRCCMGGIHSLSSVSSLSRRRSLCSCSSSSLYISSRSSWGSLFSRGTGCMFSSRRKRSSRNSSMFSHVTFH